MFAEAVNTEKVQEKKKGLQELTETHTQKSFAAEAASIYIKKIYLHVKIFHFPSLPRQKIMVRPPKLRMKLREGQKGAILPSLIWGVGLGFPFILSKILGMKK